MPRTISVPSSQSVILGIEGGATRTRVLLATQSGAELQQFTFGPGNIRLLPDRDLERLLRQIRNLCPVPSIVSAGFAGARTESERERVRRMAAKLWPGVVCLVTNDLETALAAARSAGRPRVAQVLIVSGTGSACYGLDRTGRGYQVGGWGHLLGDQGSGYAIALQGLRTVVERFGREGVWPPLGQQLLRALQLNAPNDLIGWAQSASKPDLAALGPVIFADARRGGSLSRRVVVDATGHLVNDALACAARIAEPRERVQFVLAGGVFRHQPVFAGKVARLLRRARPGSETASLRREAVWGAVYLALDHLDRCKPRERAHAAGKAKMDSKERVAISWLKQIPLERSPTERRHPRSENLGELPVSDAVGLMLREDASIPRAILRERTRIEEVIRLLVRSFKRRGRLFYAGAGTSGRLGVLDASECPPTFGTDPEQVQGIIAGGPTALWQSIEGAEDNFPAGQSAVIHRGVRAGDVLVGISASGRAPFVWGTLLEAQRRGASTVLLCCNPQLEIPRLIRPRVVICPAVGPELLTGSTRLKCGTATKLILNIFSTLSMSGIGKVMSNLMIDLRPSNSKLRDRAVRIVRELTGCPAELARKVLVAQRWNVRRAVERLRKRGRSAALRAAAASP